MSAAPWEGLRVLDMSPSLGGAFAARTIAGLGADVVRIGAAQDPAADRGVPIGGMTTGQIGYHLDKRIVAGPLDPATQHALLLGADVVICTPAQAEISPAAYPHLIIVHVSPFGAAGPYASWQADQLTIAALSGWMAVQGEQGKEPLSTGTDTLAVIAGNVTVLAVAAAIVALRRDGYGCLVDVREFEVAVAAQIFDTVAYQYTGRQRERRANEPGEPWAVLRAADGELSFAGSALRAWDELWLPVFGFELMPPWVFDADISVTREEQRAALEELVATRTKRELLEACQELGHLVGEVLETDEVLASPQHAARHFFDTVTVDGSTLRVPGPPVQFSRSTWRREHIVAASDADRDELVAQWSRRPVPAGVRDPRPPLAGRRVLDFTGGWAGPYATELLADLGADVAKIESVTRADWWRTARRMFTKGDPDPDWLWEMSPLFNSVNESKRGVTLDMNDPRGRALAHRLVVSADVVIDNFTPRVMGSFGLSYPEVQELNPRAVVVTMPGFGSTGPWSGFKSTALVAEAMAGIAGRTGYERGRSQVLQMSPADPNAGIVAAWAAIVALDVAQRDDAGQRVELAQVEAVTHHLTVELLDTQVTGQRPPRRVNTTPGAVLSGCWPCAGVDQWVSVVVHGDDEATALAALVGAPSIETEALTAALAGFAASRSKAAAAFALQTAGIAAGPVQSAVEVLQDAQLRDTDFFHELDRAHAGTAQYPSAPYRVEGFALVPRRPAPTLGADTAAVLSDWVDLDTAAYAELLAAGVTGTQPRGTTKGRVNPQ